MPHKKADQLAEIALRIMNAFHDLGRQHPDNSKLSMRQYQAMILIHTSGKLSLSQLCEKLSLAPSTGTELVNRLINLGYLQKKHQTEDQRQVKLCLTKKGEKVFLERQKVLSDMINRFLAPFSPEDREKFIDHFENLWRLIAKYRGKKTATKNRDNIKQEIE